MGCVGSSRSHSSHSSLFRGASSLNNTNPNNNNDAVVVAHPPTIEIQEDAHSETLGSAHPQQGSWERKSSGTTSDVDYPVSRNRLRIFSPSLESPGQVLEILSPPSSSVPPRLLLPSSLSQRREGGEEEIGSSEELAYPAASSFWCPWVSSTEKEEGSIPNGGDDEAFPVPQLSPLAEYHASSQKSESFPKANESSSTVSHYRQPFIMGPHSPAQGTFCVSSSGNPMEDRNVHLDPTSSSLYSSLSCSLSKEEDYNFYDDRSTLEVIRPTRLE